MGKFGNFLWQSETELTKTSFIVRMLEIFLVLPYLGMLDFKVWKSSVVSNRQKQNSNLRRGENRHVWLGGKWKKKQEGNVGCPCFLQRVKLFKCFMGAWGNVWGFEVKVTELKQ